MKYNRLKGESMKWLVILFFVTSVLWSASIDTNLFEGPEQENYLKEIQKRVEKSSKDNLYPKEISKQEKLYLDKLLKASKQDINIERFDVKGFESKKTLSIDDYYSLLKSVALLQLAIENHNSTLNETESKLIFSKKLIENITEENRAKLLYYQLQYANYKLHKKSIEVKLNMLQTHKEELTQLLLHSLSLVQFDLLEIIDKKIYDIDINIEKYYQNKISLQIDLEKAEIEESAKADQIKINIESNDMKYQQAVSEKLVLNIQKTLYFLQKKKKNEFLDLIDNIKKMTKKSSKEDLALYIEQTNIVMNLAKEIFGSTKLFFGSTVNETIEMMKRLFYAQLFVFNEQAFSIISLLKVMVLIVLGFIAGKLYKRWIIRLSRRWPDMSQMSIRLASNIGYYLIIIITLIIAMGSVGIDMTSISLVAGALSIGVGFGLQTVVSNLIAGIILMFERTIRIGDTIEISDLLRGRVTDMRIRSTTVKTFDNVDIVVPNSSFIQNNVINWTLDDLSRRLHIPFGVAYGTDVKKVINVILDELEQSDLTYIKGDEQKAPEVWMMAMNSSSLDFELLVWVEWDNKLRPNSFKSEFLILIYEALNKHGIQIPFPQMDLHIKDMPSDILK